MLLSANTMRLLLILCMTGMALLAAFYLRRREMPHWAYIAWGLLALLVPVLGPFLVILNNPGRLRNETR
jgi:4-hydroxybenzoate polyprenyltransferase